MSRRIMANLVVFAGVFVVMCAWAARSVVTIDAIEGPYRLDVELAAASGLAPDAEVAYLGVHYGRIGDIALTDGGVRAELKIDDGRRIPAGSVARVFRKSAIGEPYIDFQPPEGFDFDDGDFYEAGDTVPVEDTRTPIEFSELLRTASEVISSIEPERAATLIDELAAALDGRGDDLRRLTESMDTLSATFAERTDVLDRLAVNNTRLTGVLADHRSSLGQSLSDLAALGESLRAASGDTRVLLDRGTALLTEVADLVADARPSLDCLLADLVVVNDRAAQPGQLAGLARHLDIGPASYGLFATTRDIEPDGAWVRVNLLLNVEQPAAQHDPPLALPPAAAVPACPGEPAAASSSTLAGGSAAAAGSTDAAAGSVDAPSGDFRPSDALRASRRGALPVTGAAVAAVAAALAAVAALLVRRRVRGARG